MATNPAVATTHVGIQTGPYNTRHDAGTITTATGTYKWQVTYRIDDAALGREHGEHIYLTAGRDHVGSAYSHGRNRSRVPVP